MPREDGNGIIGQVATSVRSALRDLSAHPGASGSLDQDTTMPDREAMDARILQIYVLAVNFNCDVVTCLNSAQYWNSTASTATLPRVSGLPGLCSEDGVDFARDGFVRLTAAGAEQVLHDELARLDYTVVDLVAGRVRR